MKQKINLPVLPMEKVIYLAMVIFNLLAILMLFDFSNFIESMLLADILLLAIIRGERVATFYITMKRAKTK